MTGKEHLRRAVHVGLGGLAGVLPHLGWRLAFLACVVAVGFNGWVVPRWEPTRRMLRDTPGGGLRGVVMYPVVIGGLLLVFREDYAPTQCAWLTLAVGDGLAPYFGRWLPRPRWPASEKSVAASCVAQGAAVACLLILVPWPLAVGAGLLAALADGLLPGEDNVTIPLAAVAGALMGRWVT